MFPFDFLTRQTAFLIGIVLCGLYFLFSRIQKRWAEVLTWIIIALAVIFFIIGLLLPGGG